jgi:hypothetical protein
LLPIVCALFAVSGHAQGVISQLLSGQMVNPRVGVWAWYELTDAATGEKYFLRQAIVGEERDGRKVGQWLEVQVRPQVGFPTTYKMLLTGPASDPANIKRIYYQSGNDPIQRIEPESLEPQETPENTQPEPVNQQTIETPNGPIVCNYYKLPDGTEFWLSDAVPPMGIVRLKSPEGELRLERFGEGGPDAATALVTEEDKGGSKPAPSDDGDTPAAEAPQEESPRPANALPVMQEEESKEEKPSKKNFQGRGGKR